MNRWIGFTFSLLLLLILFGCSQEDYLLKNEGVRQPLSVMVRESSGEITRAAEGVKLGLFTEGEVSDDYSSVDYYFSSNLPYTLAGGVLTPNKDALSTDPLETANLYAYAPHVSDDNIFTEWKGNASFRYEDKTLWFDIKLDQRTEGTSSSDLLWGKSTYASKGASNNIILAHKCCKLKINLTSQLGNDLSTAKVKVLGMFTSLAMPIHSGEVNVSDVEGSPRESITAFHLSGGTFEVIVPPQTIAANSNLIEITVGDNTYIHQSQGRKLEGGQEYPYDIEVKDAGELPFTVDILYDNRLLGTELSVGSQSITKSITMTEKPVSGVLKYTKLKVRNADGSPCWVRIEGTSLVGSNDELSHEIQYRSLVVEENYGSERKMELEFYNVDFPKFVHKRVLVKQAAATNYLTLSTAALNADKWGNIYDFPELLSVQSNQGWTLENIPDWITVQGYTPGGKNQTLRITVMENETGSERNANLQFMVGGKLMKSYPIRQSIREDSPFTLKYDLTLDYSTINNWFQKDIPQVGGSFYASKIVVFAKYGPSEDTAASFNVESLYGFVTDAPASFNHLLASDLQSDYFIYKGYTGGLATLATLPTLLQITSTIHGPDSRGAQNIFRGIRFGLPIPAGVKRNQKVKFTVTIKDIKNTSEHGEPVVTYTIVNQQTTIK